MQSIASLADDVLRLAEDTAQRAGEVFEPALRIGVTGLNRSGKTVFITSLIANMLARGRMTRLSAQAQGRIEAAMLRPQPDADVPRFEYEDHLAALTGSEPSWPDSTRRTSEIRLSVRFRQTGLIGGLRESMLGPGSLHLDIIDYPGEWLLDLPLLNKSWAEWATEALSLARSPGRAPLAKDFLRWIDEIKTDPAKDELAAKKGAERFGTYLKAAREAGFSAVAPGRFLMPGDLEGTPALTFAPIDPADGKNAFLNKLMRQRFEAYKRVVVRPFFKDHFARLDRQIVMVDALSAINAGPEAVADLRKAMSEILDCFRHGENTWLSSIMGKRIERLLFAATKADHIHHTQHNRLEAILDTLVRESIQKAEYRGANVKSVALASLRATQEQTIKENGETLDCIRGRDAASGEELTVFPGALPENPLSILKAARTGQGEGDWLAEDFGFHRFDPPQIPSRIGFGPPHLRLDLAAEFLFGDKLS